MTEHLTFLACLLLSACMDGWMAAYRSSVCLSDPYTAIHSSVSAAPWSARHKGASLQSSSSVPGTVDAAIASQLPATNAAAAATGVSLPVNEGNQTDNKNNTSAYYSHHTHLHTAQHTTSPHSVIDVPGHSRPSSVCPSCGALQFAGTKHCYIDGRCVAGFDHHCVYLNTCVGERNYHLFFVFVSLVTALLTFQLFVTLWLLAHYRDDEYQRTADSSRLRHPLAWLILLTCVAVLPLFGLISISTLQCFHCYLVSSHQTTYQFIVKRRQAGQQRWQQQQQQQWQADGRAVGVDGPVLNAKQQIEQAEWMRERQRRQRNSTQQTEMQPPTEQQQSQQYQQTNGDQPPAEPRLSEEIRSV